MEEEATPQEVVTEEVVPEQETAEAAPEKTTPQEVTRETAAPVGTVEQGAVAVIGGGVAGIISALDLVDSGFKVYLIDRGASIGGKMSQLAECVTGIMPMMVELETNPDVELLTLSEVTSISGSQGNFELEVARNPRYVDELRCTGCAQCIEACPESIPDRFNFGLTNRKVIDFSHSQPVPNVPAIERDHCPPDCRKCVEVCTADAIKLEDKETKAKITVGSIILSPGYEPFDPSIWARYKLGNPSVVTSLEFERMLSSAAGSGKLLKPDGSEAKKIAFIQCIGSRDPHVGNELCSTVCCMYTAKEAKRAAELNPDLDISIFYMDVRTFGRDEHVVKQIGKKYGVKYIRSRVPELIEKGDELQLRYEDPENDEMVDEEFDLVVLAIGLLPPDSIQRMAEIAGVELDSFGYFKTELENPMDTSVPGIYVCGTAKAPMPIMDSTSWASGAAARAGSIIAQQRLVKPTSPIEAEGAGGRPKIGVFLCRCGDSISGVIDIDSLATHIERLPDVAYVDASATTCKDAAEAIRSAVKEHGLNRVVLAGCTPRIYELHFRKLCEEIGINPYLFEMANIREQCAWVHADNPDAAFEKAEELIRMSVARAGYLDALTVKRVPVVDSVLVLGGGITGMTAALEVAEQGYKTCIVEREEGLGGVLNDIGVLQDGRRASELLSEFRGKIDESELITVFTRSELVDLAGSAGNFTGTVKIPDSTEELKFGAVIVATGAEEFKPTGIYGYGERPNVVTQLEFEKLLDQGISPGTVAMIQCVGAMDDEREYCGRICCGTAVKNALRLKGSSPETEVYVLGRDVRTYGIWESMYRDARGKGVIFLRHDANKKPSFDGEILSTQDMMLNREVQIKPDYIVLSTPMVPRSDSETVAEILNISTDDYGFFVEEALRPKVKMRPLDSASAGVFLAGSALYRPRMIDECVAQGSGAAARALTLISKPFVEVEAATSVVDEELCAGCGTCVSVCPFGAVELRELVEDVNTFGLVSDAKREVAEVSERCKGCGLCASYCPSDAMSVNHFKDRQIFAQIEVVM